jgi:hypothetical protein
MILSVNLVTECFLKTESLFYVIFNVLWEKHNFFKGWISMLEIGLKCMCEYIIWFYIKIYK